MAQAIKKKSEETPPLKMTYEEFLEWADEDTNAEWVDGEIIFMSPVSQEHQDLGGFLHRIVAQFVETFQLGKVFYESFQMKLATRPSGREPDLLFIANENLSRAKKTFLDGPADLAVEIISPESGGRDRGDKFYEYEKGGVREYWLLDPERRQSEFYQLGADGLYHLVLPDADGIYRSLVLNGLWLKVGWLWQRPLPAVMTVLKEWGIV